MTSIIIARPRRGLAMTCRPRRSLDATFEQHAYVTKRASPAPNAHGAHHATPMRARQARIGNGSRHDILTQPYAFMRRGKEASIHDEPPKVIITPTLPDGLRATPGDCGNECCVTTQAPAYRVKVAQAPCQLWHSRDVKNARSQISAISDAEMRRGKMRRRSSARILFSMPSHRYRSVSFAAMYASRRRSMTRRPDAGHAAHTFRFHEVSGFRGAPSRPMPQGADDGPTFTAA